MARVPLTRDLGKIKNADHLPVMISAGCSTARFATLPPYEPYLDIHGTQHKGTNAGEVLRGPPPPPALTRRGVSARSALAGNSFARAGRSGRLLRLQ